MPGWRFRLQKVLEAKLRLEDRSKQDLSAAIRVLEREGQRLAGLLEEYAAGRREVLEVRRQGLDPQRELAARRLLDRFDEAITRQRAVVGHCEHRVIEKRRALVAAVTERKALEKLRERSHESHRRAQNAREQVETDEIGGTSFRRGQGPGTAV